MPKLAMPAIQPLAPTSSPLRPDDASSAALIALYSAALGHGPKQRYLRCFALFDAAGRTSPGWNGAASLCTLSWAVLRQLWVPALLYIAVIEGLALLALGPGRWLLQEHPQLQRQLLGILATLAWVLPGIYGDALLHTEIRKRIVTALTQTQSVSEACIFLSHSASSRERLHSLAFANAAVALAAVAALYAWLPWESWAPSAAAHPASTSVASPTSSEHTVEEARTQASSVAAAPNAPMSTAEPAAALQVPAATDSSAAGNPDDESAPPAALPVPKSGRPAAGARAPQGLPTSATAPDPTLRGEPSTGPTGLPRAMVVSTGTTPAAQGMQPGYYLNAGVFAEELNARKVQAQLLNANLPAFRQSIETAQGQRIRVRVGPFTTLQQAQAARASLRSMSLEAEVFRQ